MNKFGLKACAGLLSLAIIGALLAGLDDLPRSARREIAAERAALAAAQREFREAREEVSARVRQDAALLASVPASREWQPRFDASAGLMQAAALEMDQVAALEKQNRRQDSPRVAALLGEERQARAQALAEASAIRREAARWREAMQRAPQTAREMEHDYEALRALDFPALAAFVRMAQADWPEKKDDLEARLAPLQAAFAESGQVWLSTEDARLRIARGETGGFDLAAFAEAADKLAAQVTPLGRETAALKTLAAGLYVAWDKVLIDMEDRPSGESRRYDHKLRIVRTRFENASAQGGETTSEERWAQVSRETYEAMSGNLGMAIEHKAAGRYDSEAERTPEPAGFAYVAPPDEGSNRYGQWEHRDGRSFWVFYGQYALMRDLLFNRDYRPIERSDWQGYHNARGSGRPYYGRDAAGESGQPLYGTGGTLTRDRYRETRFAGSRYAQGGSYRGSAYAAPSTGGAARVFGRNGGGNAPRAAAPKTRGFRPSILRKLPRMRFNGFRFGR